MCVAAAIAGAAVVGGGATMAASSKAAKAQKQSAEAAAASQERMFDKQVELQAPFREAGLTAQNRILTLLGLSPANDVEGVSVNPKDPAFGRYARDFSMQDFEADPGYQFRLDEGMKALNNSMAARGMGLSGANMKGALRYGQDMGSQEYQNAFNRYQVNRSNQLNPLQSLMGAGQTSANTLTNEAGNLGRGLAETQLQAGNARASGYVGQANALSSAIGQGINGYLGFQNMNAMNQLLSRSPYLTPGGGIGGVINALNTSNINGLNNYFSQNPTVLAPR